jgi:large subunit ribosomal protein L30
MAQKTLRVKLVKGLAGCRQAQRASVRGLGLRRRHQVVEVPDTPAVRGMIEQVRHLVRVEG